MLDLPYATHRNLIQPRTGEKHVKLILIKRFLGFMDKIAKSGKAALQMLMSETKKDARSVTGSNFRNIMLLLGESHVDEIKFEDSSIITYHKIETDDLWKIEPIKEIIEAKAGNMEIPGFSKEELDDILLYLCTS